MKKSLCLLGLCAAAVCSALDLTMDDGTVYKNVTIVGTDSDSVWVRGSNAPYSYYTVRLRYSRLSPASENLLIGHISNSSSVTLSQVQMQYPQMSQIENQQVASGTDTDGGNGMLSSLSPDSGPIVLPGVPSQIFLTSIQMLGNGTIGWAQSDPDFGDNMNYGRIYVYGLIVPGLGVWNGKVYATNKTIRFMNWVVPCFAMTPETAQKINRIPWSTVY